MKGVKVLIWLSMALGLAAQPVQLAGPLSGFVFDAHAAAIRPIVGVPGAAYVGEALLGGLDWASVAPDGASALATKEGTVYGLGSLDRAEPVWRRMESSVSRPDRAAWSADGSAAVIYCSSSGLAQLIRNPGGLPALGELLAVGAGLSALAVDSEGRIVAGLPHGVYLFAPGASPLLLASTARAAAIAVSGGRLFVAGAGGEILEVEDYAGQPKALALAQVSDPVGLALSGDRKSLFIASRSDRSVEIYDLVSRTWAARLSLDVEPSTLEPLSRDAVWLVRGSTGDSDPLLVLKAGSEPSLWFVPVGRGE